MVFIHDSSHYKLAKHVQYKKQPLAICTKYFERCTKKCANELVIQFFCRKVVNHMLSSLLVTGSGSTYLSSGKFAYMML